MAFLDLYRGKDIIILTKKNKKNSGKCFKSSLAGLPLEKMNYKDTV